MEAIKIIMLLRNHFYYYDYTNVILCKLREFKIWL